jgi:hypothetical protein
MAPTLDDLLNDNRLARLFSTDIRHCALQLWILQIKFEQSIENRLVYGRLLPYDFSNNSWAASDDDPRPPAVGIRRPEGLGLSSPGCLMPRCNPPN